MFRKPLSMALCIALALIGMTGCGPTKGEGTHYTLKVSKEGEGSVTPASGQKFARGTTAVLAATPAAGWTFKEWSGRDGHLVSGGKLLMDGDKEVTAVFDERDYAGYETGRVWTYTRAYDGARQPSAVWRVIEKRTGISGFTEILLDTAGGAGPIIEKRPDGYHQVGSWSSPPHAEVMATAVLVYPNPVAVGDVVPGATVTAFETVTVHDKDYQAYKFDVTNGYQAGAMWFAPYHGLVKVDYTTTRPDGKTHHVLMELESLTG